MHDVDYPVPEAKAQRLVFSQVVLGLSPDTLYNFTLSYQTNNGTATSSQHSLRTFPKTAASIPVIFGGDIANNPTYRQMNKIAASYSPYAAFIGGDISYDNGYIECYCVYDRFLSTWEETMIRPDGAMIPIGASIGNHDVQKSAWAHAGRQ